MRKQFTDIYSLLGADRDMTQEELRSHCDKVEEECSKLLKEGKIDDIEMKAVRASISILENPEKREKYDKLGHKQYVNKQDTMLSEVDFVGGDRIYEDFYDLLGLRRDTDHGTLKRETAIRMKEMHPDSGNETAVNSEQFDTVKKARQILTNKDERSEYDEIGHNKYVKEHVDGELRGFAFTGTDSIVDSSNSSLEESDVEDLIQFTSTSTRTDPTVKAIDEDHANPSSENTGPDDRSDISDAVKKRQKREDMRGKKRHPSQEEDSNDSSSDSGSNSDYGLGIASKVILLGVVSVVITGILYIFTGIMGAVMGFIFTLGILLILINQS